MEEIQATKEEESEEEYKEYGHTLVTPNVRELSVIWRAFHAKEDPLNLAKGSKIFNT